MKPEAPDTGSIFDNKDVLRDILADKGVNDISGALRSLEEKKLTLTDKISANLFLLRNLNGQRGQALREIVKEGKSKSAKYLNSLLMWSYRASKSSPDITDLDTDIPEILQGDLSESEIIERVVLSEHNPGVGAGNFEEIRDREVRKNTVTGLGEDNIKRLLEVVGHIPLDKISKSNFSKVVDCLRNLESNKKLSNLAKHERSRVVNYLFVSGIADSIKNSRGQSVTLDNKGLFINLRGFHTHLPFAFVTDECLKTMASKGWLSQSSVVEVRLRGLDDNNLASQVENVSNVQHHDFLNKVKERSGEDFDEEYISEKIFANPQGFAEFLHDNVLIISDQAMEQILSVDKNKGYVILLSIAQSFGGLISDEKFESEDYENLEPVKRGQLEREYKQRVKLLTNPEYYNAVKIINYLRTIDVSESAENGMIVFEGKYSGGEHSFLEGFYGQILARAIFSKKPNETSNIPSFEKEEYEILERKLRALSAATFAYGEILKMYQDGRADDIPITSIETVLTFILTNFKNNFEKYDLYFDVESIYKKIKDKTVTKSEYENFLSSVNAALAGYRSNLINRLKEPDSKVEGIQEIGIDFGTEFVSRMSELKSVEYEEDLSLSSHSIRIALVNSESDTLPFHLEEMALDTIRVNRNRPLINIIGGSSNISNDGEESLERIVGAVMHVGHERKANIGVPGTQSGMGAIFGRANIKYEETYKDLPLRDQARMFSIIPGGETYFPGNPYDEDGSFAINTVDSIVTDKFPDWNAKGFEKLNSPYLKHIKHMESLYKRMSVDQPRVTVVGNGGFFSIMEVSESLSDGFNILLIKGTGRFAEIASLILDNVDLNSLPEDGEDVVTLILELINREMKNGNLSEEIVEEFLRKDFGSQIHTDNEDYVVYRNKFIDFIKNAMASDKVRTTTIAGISKNLEDIL